jgi:acetyl esterase
VPAVSLTSGREGATSSDKTVPMPSSTEAASQPDVQNDDRLDPRVKRALRSVPWRPVSDIDSRERLLEISNSESALALRTKLEALYARFDTAEVAPFDGLRIETSEFASSPDGNIVKVQFIRPDSDDVVPGIVYLHGGGMQTGSCFDALYRMWGRLLAHQGVAVAMIDFRNCLTASSAPQIEPFPAGLNDCVSGVRWTVANAVELGIDAARVVVAGESGGGNLTLATGMQLLRDGDMGLVRGLYALCPYIAGRWPQERFPSSIENEGILLNLHHNRGAVAYGLEQLDAGNPLAWPSFATDEDVRGLAPTFISVNEADPLRDEGIEFYRLLLRAGVSAQCRVVMGTSHGMDVFAAVLPDVAAQTAASVALFART